MVSDPYPSVWTPVSEKSIHKNPPLKKFEQDQIRTKWVLIHTDNRCEAAFPVKPESGKILQIYTKRGFGIAKAFCVLAGMKEQSCTHSVVAELLFYQETGKIDPLSRNRQSTVVAVKN